MEEEKNGIKKSEEDDSEKIRRLEAQVLQLKNIIIKLTHQQSKEEQGSDHGSFQKKGRPFDFNLYTKRHVALHVCYFGWDFHGFAVQEITGRTIESELFHALTLTKLIKNREESNYHRCGRTDKGVSAFQQVITIDLRSNLLEGQGTGVMSYDGCKAEERIGNSSEKVQEINYCKLINSNLPPFIQVIGWAPLSRPDFSARFDCTSRTYKYYFPRGDLDLSQINEAGKILLGEHDFRNFCKMDVAHGVINYHRKIISVDAEALEKRDSGNANEDITSPFDLCVLTIKGKAFLWHQIRCIVAVLFRVASGRESTDIVSELLDIDANPTRPQYAFASEIPLNLFQCDFEEDLEWVFDEEAIQMTIRQLQDLWTEHSIKTIMFKQAIDNLNEKTRTAGIRVNTDKKQADWLYHLAKSKSYISLKDLPKCPSLEKKISSINKRRKIV